MGVKQNCSSHLIKYRERADPKGKGNSREGTYFAIRGCYHPHPSSCHSSRFNRLPEKLEAGRKDVITVNFCPREESP